MRRTHHRSGRSVHLQAPLLVAGLLAVLAACGDEAAPERAPSPAVATPELPGAEPWWRHRAHYAVVVRAFQDTDGDGVGDFRGLADRLRYLRDLGVGVVRLEDAYVASDLDGWRAADDWTRPDPRLGGEEAFAALVSAAHALGMRLVVTLPLNHVGWRHPWYRALRLGEHAPLVTAPAEGPACADLPTLPGDPYGDRRWYRLAEGLWVYHRTATTAADVDWRDPAVFAAAQTALTAWFARGVDGIHLPWSFAWIEASERCEDTAATHARLRELRAWVTRTHPDRWLSGTAIHPARGLAAGGERLRGYLGPSTAPELDAVVAPDPLLPFAALLRGGAGTTGLDVARAFADLAQGTTEPSWMLPTGGLELPRPGALVADPRAHKAYLATLLGAPGIPLLFYGDELALDNATVLTGDPRSAALVAMPWSSTAPTYDFGGTPALPVAVSADERNVAAERADAGSPWSLVARLLAARNARLALRSGPWHELAPRDPATGALRSELVAWFRGADADGVAVLVNLSPAPVDFVLRVEELPWPLEHALIDLAHPERAVPRWQAGLDGWRWELPAWGVAWLALAP